MAEAYIEALKYAIKDVYPNLNNKSAYALVLNGFGDMFSKDLPY